MQMALVYLSSGNEDHLNSLVDMQSVDGDYNGDILTTAMAALALKEAGRIEEFDSAKAWLISRQRNDGSWGDVFTTSTALYAIYDGEQLTFRSIADVGAVEVCNEDNLCDANFGENSFNCPLDCFCGDDVCDSEESPNTCPADCGEPEPTEPVSSCGDGVCDFDEDNDTCPADCPREGGFPWFWTIVVVLLLVLAFFLYFKFHKKTEKPSKPLKIKADEKKEKPKYRPPTKRAPSKPKRKSRTESELEKSLKEARKLLKK